MHDLLVLAMTCCQTSSNCVRCRLMFNAVLATRQWINIVLQKFLFLVALLQLNMGQVKAGLLKQDTFKAVSDNACVVQRYLTYMVGIKA